MSSYPSHSQETLNKGDSSSSSSRTDHRNSTPSRGTSVSGEDGQSYHDIRWRSHENRSMSKSFRFQGSDDPTQALKAMREVLDKLWENDVQGPQLFRLDHEFGLELGRGTQFKVSGPLEDYMKKLKYTMDCNPEPSVASTLQSLTTSVVKRAIWIPDVPTRRPAGANADQQRSKMDVTKELHSQLTSAKNEIDKLCNRAYKTHPNIVRLRGWGLCLDTFEATTPLNTRIPLLILERATCDLGDFLASSNYQQASYEDLVKICTDIGTGLGGLHRGDVTHGDMKPENVLLFAELQPGSSRITWTAKLCDFGNSETKGSQKAASNNESIGPDTSAQTYMYDGTPGWTPPEALFENKFDFDELKRCDIFVYGLIVWRVFGRKTARGAFESRNGRRGRRIPPIIDEESRIQDYLKKDRAYRDASADVRTTYATEIEDSFVFGNLLFKIDDMRYLKKPPQSHIPSLAELKRILRVLRAALQPVPKYRDSRPWRFLDRVQHPTIAPFLETPGKAKDDILAGDTMADATFQATRSRVEDSFFSKFTISPVPYKMAFPNFSPKSPRKAILDRIFADLLSTVPLGRDLDAMDILEHDVGPCFDLSSFRWKMFSAYTKAAPTMSQETTYELYSYARIRSRFKLCCWQVAVGQIHDQNALRLVLHNSKSGDGKVAAHSFDCMMRTISWLSRGTIGEQELRDLEDSQESALNMWSWSLPSEVKTTSRYTADRITIFSADQSQITQYNTRLNDLEIQNLLFHLFVEKGCFVGHNLGSLRGFLTLQIHGRNGTIFSRFLQNLVDDSVNGGGNSKVQKEIITACAKICQTSQLCISQASHPGRNESDMLRSKRSFFFRGESPDLSTKDLNFSNSIAMKEIKATTILHEAVFSCCYTAVEYFVEHGTIPLMVRDANGETALELAQRMKIMNPGSWQRRTLNLIIGLLSPETKVNDPENQLPLGWEHVQLGQDMTAFYESTINPRQPSLTFERPKFSLLQETQISLGARKAAEGDLTYRFDLVRFIHRSRTYDTIMTPQIFDEEWYHKDIQYFRTMHRDFSTFFTSMYDWHVQNAGPWAQWVSLVPSMVYGSFTPVLIPLRLILLSNYINILLVLVPIALLYQPVQPMLRFSLASGAILPVVHIMQTALVEIRLWDVNPSTLFNNQTLLSRLGFCVPELCIGILALLSSDIEVVQLLIIGSMMCNILLVPGICFMIGGVHNSRTGTVAGIEQDFNSTASSTASTLTIFGAVASVLLYTFHATQPESPIVDNSVALLSYGISLVLLIVFGGWICFRHYSHTVFFDYDAWDGYDDGTHRFRPHFSPWSNIVIICTCLVPLALLTGIIVSSLHLLPSETRKWLVMLFIPIVLPVSRHWKSLQSALDDHLNDLLDLTLGYCVSLCLLIVPLLGLISFHLGTAFTLRFDLFGTMAYALSVFVMWGIVVDGKSNYLEGFMLLVIYTLLILALSLIA